MVSFARCLLFTYACPTLSGEAIPSANLFQAGHKENAFFAEQSKPGTTEISPLCWPWADWLFTIEKEKILEV
jgi:hypothetical protein